MINDLNTVLLEGTCISTEDFYPDNELFSFMIENNYSGYKLPVSITIKGKAAIEAKEKAKPGRKVRIVGRLRLSCSSTVCILADHIVYKPEVKK